MKNKENIFQKIGNILEDKDLKNYENIKTDSNFIIETVPKHVDNNLSFLTTKNKLNLFLEISKNRKNLVK